MLGLKLNYIDNKGAWYVYSVEILWPNRYLNHLQGIFSRRNINMYLQFISFLRDVLAQEIEIFSHVRQPPVYSASSISWLLMVWRRN